MTMVFLLVVMLTICIGKTQSIRCYQGFDSWGPAMTRNVTLKECPSSSKCCFILSSLPGSTYGCYANCPGAEMQQCGPGPVPNAPMDVGWCYCKTENDTLCMPYYFATGSTTAVQTGTTTAVQTGTNPTTTSAMNSG